MRERAIVTDSGRIVGFVSSARLTENDGIFRGEYDIGWNLRPSETGHGYATEGARILARELFADGLREIVIDMFPDNSQSAAVARRLGADEIGVVPDPWYGDEGRIFRLRPEHLDRNDR